MISLKPWSIDAVARLFMGVIATFCCGMFLSGILEALNNTKGVIALSPDQLQFAQMVILITLFQGAALVWIAFFLRQSNITWREAFGLRPRSRALAVAMGLAAGVLSLPFMWALQWLSQLMMEWCKLEPVAQVAVTELQNSHLSMLEKILFGVFTILLAPAAEEALFRGILYPTVKQSGHPRWALWGTSVLFGIMHFNLATLIPLIFLAVVLVFLYEYSESLLAPIAAHATFNAVNFFYLIFAEAINHSLHLT